MKKLSKKFVIIILAVILFLQVVARIYLGNKKEYFHMDEMYSYGLMNYDKIDIFNNEDFYNTWHDKEYYADYITVNKDEMWDLSAVYENQKNDVHPPLYYLLLRLSSTFTVDRFTKWTGITLNILIFVSSNILVYFIAKKIFKRKILAMLVCVINGFTFMSLESSNYIRMYELSNFSIVLLIYTQLRILEKDKLKFVNCIPIMIALLIGGLTHYYFFIFALIMYFMYVIKCIREKKYKNLVVYNVSMVVAGIIYLLIFPYSLQHVFFGYRGLSAGGDEYFGSLVQFLGIMLRNIGRYFLIFVPVILYILTRNKEKQNVQKVKSNIDYIFIPLLAYFLIIAKNAPYKELRYLIPIYSAITICIVYFIWKYLKQYFTSKKAFKVLSILCTLIILVPFITGMKFDFTYSKFNHIADRVQEKNLPIIYVFNTDKNRFLDDLYLFTLVDKSIVIDSKNIDDFKDEMKQIGHYILICNDEEIQDKVIENKQTNFLEHMNACYVWEITE